MLNIKEHLNRILEIPELELDENAYKGKYDLNNAKSIKDFVLGNLRKTYENIDTGDEIAVSRNSSGKIVGSYRNGESYQKTIVHIPEIIKNMQFLEKQIPEKEGSKYNNYSYYITGINMDGKSYAVFSIVGYNERGVYYVHNVFEGTRREVFAKAEKEAITDSQYKRLAEILEKAKKGGWSLDLVVTKGTSTDPINKYTKIFEEKQEKNEK